MVVDVIGRVFFDCDKFFQKTKFLDVLKTKKSILIVHECLVSLFFDSICHLIAYL